jgi:PAS domain S-box-containing protein
MTTSSRTMTKQALRDSAARARLLSELAADFTYILRVELDGTLAVEWASDNFAALTGYQPAHLADINALSELVHPADRSQLVARQAALLKGDTVTSEFRVLAQDGRWLWARDRARGIWDADHTRIAFIYGAVQDITTDRRTQDTLRASEARLRHITDNTHDLICEIDQHGIFRYASSSHQAVLGYDPRTLIGRSIAEYAHPDDLARIQPVIQQMLKQGDTGGQVELRMRHADGHYLWVESISQLVFDEQRQILGAVLINRDITPRKRDEEALARYARGLAALYEVSLEINSQPDVATLLKTIVLRAIDLLQAKMGGLYLINEDDHALVLVTSEPPEFAGNVLRSGEGLAGRVAQIGAPIVVADYSRWPDRSPAYEGMSLGRVVGVPLKLRSEIMGVLSVEDAEPGMFSEEEVRLVSMFADQAALAIENRRLVEQTQRELWERQRAEEALRDSERRYRTLVENQGEGICFFDDNENLTFANPAAHEIFGLPVGDLVGRSLKDFMLPEEFAVVRQETEIRRLGWTSTYENRIIRSDGQIRTLLVTARPRFDEDGSFLGAFGIFRDITDLKHAEALLHRAAERRLILYRASQEISASLDSEQLYTAIHRAVAQLMPCEDLVIDLYLEARHEVVSLYILERGQRVTVPPHHADLGLAGQLIRTGQSLRLNNLEEIERTGIQQIPYGEGIPTASILAVPLRIKERIIGMLSAQSYHAQAYTADDQELLEMLATQAANALENTRLFEEVQQAAADLEVHNRQLTQILEAGNLLRMNLDLDAVLKEIVRGAHRALGYNIVVLNLVDEELGQMWVHSYAGLDEAGQQALDGARYKWEQERRLMRPEYRLGRAYFVPAGALDWQQEATGPIYEPHLPIPNQPDAWHPHDALFVPIELRDGHIAGTIWLDAPKDGQRPRVESLRPLEIFVNQAAIAIENARLFEAERQRRRELEAVYSASRQLTQSLDLAEVLDAILSSVMQLVPAASAQLFWYDGEHLTFGSGLSESGHAMIRPPLEPRPAGLTYTVARTGEALFVEDTVNHPVFNLSSSFQPPLLAVASLPLKIEAAVLGVMNVSYATPHHFGEPERDILSLLAAQAAIALHNARLHRQVQSYAGELERRVAERTAELDHERQHLQAILDSAGEGIQIMDPDWRIMYVNPATEQITGYRAEEMIGQRTRLGMDNLNPFDKLNQVQKQLAAGQAWKGEVINRRKDGTPYDSAVTVTPLIDKDAHVTGYVVVHRDISGLKELDHLKDQFVSRIGHELRTPVANIKLYGELLERGKPDKQHDYIHTLQRETERLRHLIDGFLEMSELDAGRAAIYRSTVELNQLVVELIHDRRDQLKARQLELVTQFATAPTGLTVQTDRALLARVINILLDNALHYAPHGATITVVSRVADAADQHWRLITVHNTGPGLSSEELPHMFERFYRGEAARDYKVPGAGLGLAIAHTIMQRLEGRLTVESQTGQGVTFALWLLQPSQEA